MTPRVIVTWAGIDVGRVDALLGGSPPSEDEIALLRLAFGPSWEP